MIVVVRENWTNWLSVNSHRHVLSILIKLFFFVMLIILQVGIMLFLSVFSYNSNNQVIKNRLLNGWELISTQPSAEKWTLCFSSTVQFNNSVELNSIGNALMNFTVAGEEPCIDLKNIVSSQINPETIVRDYSRQWVGSNIVSRLILNFGELDFLIFLTTGLFVFSLLIFFVSLNQEIDNLIVSSVLVLVLLRYLYIPSWISNVSYSLPF